MKKLIRLYGAPGNERGAALIIVLGLMMLMWLVGTMAVENATTENEMTFNQIDADQASYIAEAGARYAVAQLWNDSTWRMIGRSCGRITGTRAGGLAFSVE